MDKNKILFLSFLAICIFLAFYFRVIGLSNGGFSNSDEYYIVKSVHNILEYGIPKYPLGGYYVRGLIYQYFSALLILTGIKDEFALRIIPVIFNMLALPALYLLGKKIGGKIIGVSILFLFCFSILEIEYARLARYYAPFQTIFIWYMYCFYKVVVEKDSKNFNWMLILSIAGVLMYEGGIFLVVLNFIPFILLKEKISFIKMAYSIVIMIGALVYLNFGFRNYGVDNYLPTDVKFKIASGFAPIDLPYLFIKTFSNIYLYLLWIIPLTAVIIYGFYIDKAENEKRIKFIFLTLALLSLFNLYGILFILFLILYLISWIKIDHLKSKSFYYLLILLSLNFIFFTVYSLTTKTWITFFPEESSISINKIFWVFINYPNFYEKIFLPWYSALPILTFILFLFIAFYFLIRFKSKTKAEEVYAGANILLAVTIILICLVALLKTPYNDVRYTFFIYPLLLLLLLFSMKSIAEFLASDRKIALGIFILCFLTFVLVSSDFNLKHLLKIDSNEIRFRSIYEPVRENIYYFQEDYISPADIINKNMSNEDLVVTTQAPIEYYLKKLDYNYINYNDGEFTIRSRMRGQKEVWTNARLIYKESDLFNLLKNSKATIWLSNFSNRRPGVSPEERRINDEFSKYLYYVNFDSTINVYKIPHISKKF
jgi:hypothetical protein